MSDQPSERCSAGSDVSPHELHSFHDQLPAQGDGQILFHPLPTHADFLRPDVVEGPSDELGFITAEVVKNIRILWSCGRLVALLVCGPSLLSIYMIVFSNLVLLVGEEGLAADVAVGHEGEESFGVELANVSLGFEEHRERRLLQCAHLLKEILDAFLLF